MSDGSRTIGPAEVPPELENLKRVEAVPTVLVAFLVAAGRLRPWPTCS